MNPHLKYQTAQSWSWTRIDMLLLIYDKTLSTLNEGARLLDQNRIPELLAVRIRAMKALLAIADGLDVEQGELAVSIMRLVIFAIDQIRTSDSAAWRNAAQVLSTVREGFLEIQDQARRDEYEGRIPALDAVM